MQMNWMANASSPSAPGLPELVARLLIGAMVASVVFWLIHTWIMNRVGDYLSETRIKQLALWNALSFTPALVTLAGINGILMTQEIFTAILVGMIALILIVHIRFESAWSLTRGRSGLGFLFLISGFAALIYQVAWQRVLFTTFGVNMESVTLVVSVFMFGLGIGSIVGGMLSERFPDRLREMFFACEVVIGFFGVASISIIRVTSDVVISGSLLSVGVTIFAILCLPTMMMGATLPILVSYVNQSRQNVGNSVGWLYSFNTLGSALAALLTVTIIFPAIGLKGAVWTAAIFNFLVAWLVIQNIKTRSSTPSPAPARVT